MKFARPRDSTKLCYIHDITTGIFMLRLNKFHHTGISILVFFTMHTFICSNFQINLCKSIQQDINHFRSNQSNLSNTHSITLILSLAVLIWRVTNGQSYARMHNQTKISPYVPINTTATSQSHVTHVSLTESSASKIKTYSINFDSQFLSPSAKLARFNLFST